ncbi:MAG TPA: HAD family phosphatase [Bacteroidales bacterium]|nr:HAD family phosphatase [Bacteroidales bacterium]
MIRNIIFDLGNVLLSWKPEEYLINNGYPERERRVILEDVFRSREWLALDNGDMTLDEAVRRISLNSSLKTGEIYSVFNLRLKILSPITANTKVVPELKKAGFRLYYLSNFPEDIFDEVEMKHEFFSFFDGGFISARAKASKPDEKIFRLLLDTYDLKPEECLFIDDTHANAVSAGAFGISVIHLSEPLLLRKKIEDFLEVSLGH